MCVYIFFFLIGKKARAFQELEFIKLVNKLKHWLLFPESQDTIQGLMNCTRSCSVMMRNPQAPKPFVHDEFTGPIFIRSFSFAVGLFKQRHNTVTLN